MDTTREEIEAELREWVKGDRSWCDQHHALPNSIELTARADEATIRLLTARLEALDALGPDLALTPESGHGLIGELFPGTLAALDALTIRPEVTP